MTEVRFGSVYHRTELIRVRRVHFQLSGTDDVAQLFHLVVKEVTLLELQGHTSRTE